MEFRLTYDGPLASNGSATDKQAVRRKLHLQLRELWRADPLIIIPRIARRGPILC